MANYSRFGMMIVTSTLVMFVLMYLNTYITEHVYFSETRLYMALMMGASMAMVMFPFMRSMYTNKGANALLLLAAAAAFVVTLWLVRSQATISDVSYMKAMIPHHSIAILTSRRANIRDPRVRELADGIIDAQVREIDEMQRLIAALEAKPLAGNAPALAPVPAE